MPHSSPTQKLKLTLLAGICLSFFSCQRTSINDRTQALRPVRKAPPLSDDLPLEPYIAAIRNQVAVLERSTDNRNFVFGVESFTKEEYVNALKKLLTNYDASPSYDTFFDEIESGFDFYEVYGGARWGEILLTSYYEPEIPGSRFKTPKYSQPLYRPPSDLLEVILPRSEAKLSDIGTVRGKLRPHPLIKGKMQVGPYYTRAEIDEKDVLAKQSLNLVWVDPIDAFFLHIQGSGNILVEGGHPMRVGYADQNGHAYDAIGKYITDVVPLDKITLHSLEAHLRTLPLEEAKKIMHKNPSYIFFKELTGPALTSLGTPAVAGRTIATDPRFFPKGALSFMVFQKPVFDSAQSTEPTSWEATSRFLLDQDTGGAIKGPGRADLFWGTGPSAKQSAGVMKNSAYLFYLAPKRPSTPQVGLPASTKGSHPTDS